MIKLRQQIWMLLLTRPRLSITVRVRQTPSPYPIPERRASGSCAYDPWSVFDRRHHEILRRSELIKHVENSPQVHDHYPQRVSWGDMHLNTSYSTDAGMIGNFLGPETAYQFARGETVRASGGAQAKLEHPLDFLVVADHAENLGLAPLIEESNPELLSIPWGKEVHDLVKAGKPFEAYGEWGLKMNAREDPIDNDDLALTIWRRPAGSA